MPSISLRVVSPPAHAADPSAPDSVKPLFRGNGDIDYRCGSCGAIIAADMSPTQHVIVDTTVCAGCGATNEFPVELRA